MSAENSVAADPAPYNQEIDDTAEPANREDRIACTREWLLRVGFAKAAWFVVNEHVVDPCGGDVYTFTDGSDPERLILDMEALCEAFRLAADWPVDDQ